MRSFIHLFFLWCLFKGYMTFRKPCISNQHHALSRGYPLTIKNMYFLSTPPKKYRYIILGKLPLKPECFGHFGRNSFCLFGYDFCPETITIPWSAVVKPGGDHGWSKMFRVVLTKILCLSQLNPWKMHILNPKVMEVWLVQMILLKNCSSIGWFLASSCQIFHGFLAFL